MSQGEEFDIPLEELETIAKQCEKRKSLKRKSKLAHFDSASHELQKYKLKVDQSKGSDKPEQQSSVKGIPKQKIQQFA